MVSESGNNGITLNEVFTKLNLSRTRARGLLEAGLGIGLLLKNDEKYTITKQGHFILQDEMTKVNMDFTHAHFLLRMLRQDSILEGKPTGLKKLGDWPTIYEGLALLPPGVKESWFNFDHFYSDGSFDQALLICLGKNQSTFWM